jgi:hypothetical protein
MRLLPLWLPLCLWPVFLPAAEPVLKPGDLPRIPPPSPAQAAANFTIRPGFRVELMVAEPLIVSPVAMAFDENGNSIVGDDRLPERRDEAQPHQTA